MESILYFCKKFDYSFIVKANIAIEVLQFWKISEIYSNATNAWNS